MIPVRYHVQPSSTSKVGKCTLQNVPRHLFSTLKSYQAPFSATTLGCDSTFLLTFHYFLVVSLYFLVFVHFTLTRLNSKSFLLIFEKFMKVKRFAICLETSKEFLGFNQCTDEPKYMTIALNKLLLGWKKFLVNCCDKMLWCLFNLIHSQRDAIYYISTFLFLYCVLYPLPPLTNRHLLFTDVYFLTV